MYIGVHSRRNHRLAFVNHYTIKSENVSKRSRSIGLLTRLTRGYAVIKGFALLVSTPLKAVDASAALLPSNCQSERSEQSERSRGIL